MNEWLDKVKSAWARHWRDNEVKSFHENQEKEEAFDTVDRGLESVPLDQIVGSVGRYHDFDRKFRLKSHLDSDRLKRIRQVLMGGGNLPPVILFQIKNEYYVVDGNHRVSAAKNLGFQQIDAHILEFLPSKNTLENILYREKTDFEDTTGLKLNEDLTEVGQYIHLLDQIVNHRDFLEDEAGEPVSLPEAARDWHSTICLPLMAIIRKGGLLEQFPGRTSTDLYAYISLHQWQISDQPRRYGIGINQLVPGDMEEFRKKMMKLKEPEYPEMLRRITAFILINVSTRKEMRIVDKLFELPEVREVHSVHGNVDIVVKIILERDLLSSDAETICEFVYEKVRQIPGVISTQTLIPGRSKIKSDETDNH